jgi:hypothetical protein
VAITLIAVIAVMTTASMSLPAVYAKKHHLPLCDGSVQDCKTQNGDVCKKGSTEDKCECADDLSDCPNSPNKDEILSFNKNNGLTDTQKEDSTASDANGNPCDLGPAHDECSDQ